MLTRFFYENFVKNTAHKALITVKRSLFCTINEQTYQLIASRRVCMTRNVYLSTIVLKHVHDRHVFMKGVPDVFEFILENLIYVLTKPDAIYENAPDQRAHFLIMKEFNGDFLLCGIEIVDDGNEIDVVTSFMTDLAYLKKFTQL